MPVPTSTLAAGTTMPGETPYAGPQRVDKTVKRRISEIVNMLQFAFTNVTRNAGGPAWAEAKRFSYDRIATVGCVGVGIAASSGHRGGRVPKGHDVRCRHERCGWGLLLSQGRSLGDGG